MNTRKSVKLQQSYAPSASGTVLRERNHHADILYVKLPHRLVSLLFDRASELQCSYNRILQACLERHLEEFLPQYTFSDRVFAAHRIPKKK